MSLNVANVTLSDSFNTWRLRTNAIIDLAAQGQGSANNSANTIYTGRQTYNNFTTHNANTTHNATFAGSTITATNVASTVLNGATINGTNINGTTITAADFNSTSDVRLKINISSIENPIEKITQLNGVRFDWKESNKPSIGLIAQEVEQIIPEVVHENNNGFKTINYGLLVAILIEAVKNQQHEINTLKANSRKDEDGN